MSIDRYLNKHYDRDSYNCAHFVADVIEGETGRNVRQALDCFLFPAKERTARAEIRRYFEKLSKPIDYCIVLMQRPKTVPHVGVYIRGKVLQIHENGVEYQPMEIATRGFTKTGLFKCNKYS